MAAVKMAEGNALLTGAIPKPRTIDVIPVFTGALAPPAGLEGFGDRGRNGFRNRLWSDSLLFFGEIEPAVKGDK